MRRLKLPVRSSVQRAGTPVLRMILSVINPESLVIKQGFAEPSLKDAVAGKAFQFEREGYFA